MSRSSPPSRRLVAALLLASSPAALGAASLTDAVRRALAHHPELAAADHERAATVQELERARGAYRAQLDASAEYGVVRGDSDSAGLRDDSPSRRLALTLNQPLYDPAKLREIDRQRARVEAAAEGVRDRREAVTLGAVERYLEVWRAERAVALSAENIERHRATLTQVEGRLAAGEGGLGDVKQAESRLTEARATGIDNLRILEQERAAYRRVVGVEPDDPVPPPFPSETLPADPRTAVETALAESPAMARAEAEVSAAEAAMGVAEAGFLPTLGAELLADAGDNVGGVRGGDENLQGMVVLRYNLYAGGGDRARKREAAARRLVAVDRLNELRLQLEEQLRRAWIAIERGDQKLALLARQEETAERVVEIYRKEFEIGQHSLLDLLDAERERFDVRVRRAEAEKASQLARYQLLAAMGRLTGTLERLPAQPVVETPPATPEPPAEAPPEPPAPVADTGADWVVLIAADRPAAESLAGEVAAHGYARFIAPLDDGRHAVSLGVFRQRPNADALIGELRALGFHPTRLTRRVP